MRAVVRRCALLLLLVGCGFFDKDRELPPDLSVDPDAPVAGDGPADGPLDAGPDGPLDMAPDGPVCGDDVCDLSEDEFTCPADCGCAGDVPNSCGDFAPSGCGCYVCCLDFGDCCPDAASVCGIAGTPCGNGVCDVDCESSSDCPADCTCGDDLCDSAEDDVTCPGDCGCAAGSPNSCGDFAPLGCSCDLCCVDFVDCCDDADTVCGITNPACGNGTCESCESISTCPADC